MAKTVGVYQRPPKSKRNALPRAAIITAVVVVAAAAGSLLAYFV